MKLAIASDIHLEENPLDGFDDQGADAIVLAGDIHASPNGLREFVQSLPSSIPKILILGNHEYDHWKFPALGFALDDYRVALRDLVNVHLLERERLEIGDVTILGATLWSDFLHGDQIRKTDYVLASIGDAHEVLKIHKDTVRWLRRELRRSKKPTVVVTHMAPSYLSFRERKPTGPIDGFFASNLNELIEQAGPALWIHGHLHNPSDYMVGRTRVICNPRGYGDPIAWYESWTPLVVEVPSPDA